MLSNKEIVVVMPAYNAEKTLRQTYEELPHEYVDEVILVEPSRSASVAGTATWRRRH
jgi:NifB/MoaA-like Fe-S oxidoreductase